MKGGAAMALSDIKIRKAKPKERPYKLADRGGLFVLVTQKPLLWRFFFVPPRYLRKNSTCRCYINGAQVNEERQSRAGILIFDAENPKTSLARHSASARSRFSFAFSLSNARSFFASDTFNLHGGGLFWGGLVGA
jgi:hypothetical protein